MTMSPLVFALTLVAAISAQNTTTTANATAPVCWKDTEGRGVGKPISACTADQEKSGLLCYPKCRDATPSFYGVGPVCWQHCKPGYVDEGALCRKEGSIVTYAKKSYGRGAGFPLTCAEGLQNDAGLCYPPCKLDWAGNGPVCWERCTKANPSSGGAICCTDAVTCNGKIKNLVAGVPEAIVKAILAGDDWKEAVKAAEEAVEAALGYVMPLCDAL